MSAPMTLALAPSATNTVENPRTNNAAATTVSRFTWGFASLIRKTFERGACHKHKIRRHKRQHSMGKKTDETRNQSSQESDFAIHGAH